MISTIIYIFLLFSVVIFLLWVGVGVYLVRKILYPRKITLEEIYQDPELMENWEMSGTRNLGDFGLKYERAEFPSFRRGSPLLKGWFVPGSQKTTIVMVHGRWSNRLKTLPYLKFLAPV